MNEREQKEEWLWYLVNTAWPLLFRNKDSIPGAEQWLREYGKFASQLVEAP